MKSFFDRNIESWTCTLMNDDFLLLSFAFNFVLSMVHWFCVLSKQLQCYLRWCWSTLTNLPFKNSEINLVLFKNIDANVKEFSIEKMSNKHNSCKPMSFSQTGCLPFSLLNVLHIIFLMFLSLFFHFPQIQDVFKGWCKLSMTTNNSFSNFIWNIIHLFKR